MVDQTAEMDRIDCITERSKRFLYLTLPSPSFTSILQIPPASISEIDSLGTSSHDLILHSYQ